MKAGEVLREMDWQQRVRIDPKICHGTACIKGTRVMVSVILDNLAEGESYESIIEGCRVMREDIQAALSYAAELIRECE
jgi:uncharacterized protein (DUF433 family)